MYFLQMTKLCRKYEKKYNTLIKTVNFHLLLLILNAQQCFFIFLVQLRPGKDTILYTKIYLLVKAAKKLLKKVFEIHTQVHTANT